MEKNNNLQLTHLDLSYNLIQQDEAIKLAKVLLHRQEVVHHHPYQTLVYLNLSHNMIGPDSAKFFAKLAKLAIKHLDLRYNWIEPISLK